MPYKSSSDSLSSSSSFDDDNNNDSDNTDNKLMALSDKKMKEKDFDGFN